QEPQKSTYNRVTDAAIGGGEAELGGQAALGAGNYLFSGAAPAIQATEKLGDLADKAIKIGKGGITVIRAADGSFRSLNTAMTDPNFLEEFGGINPQSAAVMTRAWLKKALEAGTDNAAEAFEKIKDPTSIMGPYAEDVGNYLKAVTEP